MRKSLLLLLILLTTTFALTAQQQVSGEIQGRIVDEKGQGIPFANVVLSLNGIQVTGTATDFNGFFSVKPLDPGRYLVSASYIGKVVNISDVAVSAGRTTFIDNIVINTSEATQLDVIEIKWERPAIDHGKPETGTNISREQIEKMPRTDLVGTLSYAAGTYQSDEGLISIGGSRGNATRYMVDGMWMIGTVDLPMDAVDEVNIITSGVDASQGDFTGGIVSFSTRGPSRKHSGSVEYFTSQFLDPFGYHEARFSALGPLLNQYRGTDSARAMVGYLLTGTFRYELDTDPPALDMYVVKEDVLADLKANPLRPSAFGEGLVKSTELVHLEDMRTVRHKLNNDGQTMNLYGKIDIKPSLTTNITIGSSFYHNRNNAYINTFHMFNSENHPKTDATDIRGYVKFRQSFTPDKDEAQTEQKSGYTIDNAFYTIQVDYQKLLRNTYDRNHGFDPFQYAYIGNFETYREPVYFYALDSVTGHSGYRLFGYRDTAVHFTPGDANEVLTRYTEQYYERNNPRNLSEILLGGGLRNGDFTQSLYSYSMWYNPGVPYTSYGYSNTDQYGTRFDASLDLSKSTADRSNRHSLQFGFEYQQRIQSSYNVSPFNFWLMARQNTNFHLANLDVANPYYVINGEKIHYSQFTGQVGEYDTIFYNRLYNQSDQRYFDIQLRQRLGLPVDGLDFINVDAVDPSLLSIEMFSPDELLLAGNRRVSTVGYDYYGNRFRSQPSWADYWYDFNDVNGNGVQDFGEYNTRPIAAFTPIYTAAYLQDRFNIGRVIFRVGLRVERYDANTKVLRDKYSLYGIRSASEVTNLPSGPVNHPDNIGSDYAVYVNNIQNPTQIIGYRSGDLWYDAQGNELADPNVLVAGTGGTGNIAPYLRDPSANIKSSTFDVDESFKDYVPQINAVPRIAFSFPITETAMFTAHYDVLVQRPVNNQAQPYHYYYLQEIAIDGVIPNPDLRPEKTINYQLGFQQALSDDSRLSISAFYRELRDMTQVQRLNFSYPVIYTTFGNVDFGTVKGLIVAYDLIRRKNNMLVNASYTLQFADGTGSNTTSQINLVGVGQPNMRTIVPLDYDVRHTFNLTLDYRLPTKAGPMIAGNRIFQNTGFNLGFRGRTGEPYTRSANPNPTAQFGVRTSNQMQGTINGSRLPFNYRLDLRVDKDFIISRGKDKSPLALNVYLVSQNLLNTRNIIAVYSYTGSAIDDGYIASPFASEVLVAQLDQQAFIDQYYAKVQNPSMYSLPRRMQIGARLRF